LKRSNEKWRESERERGDKLKEVLLVVGEDMSIQPERSNGEFISIYLVG